MTADEQYVPSEDEMRHAYWLTRMLDHHAALDAAFDRFLARVRRDAARDAMEDLASDFDLMGSQEDGPEVARWIRAVIDTEYPEETP